MTFTYGDVAITVRSHEASHLSWLAEFLSPWFGARSDADADVKVVFRAAAAEEWLGLVAETDGRSTDVDCFVLDTRVVRHPARHDGNGGMTVVDRELEAAYRVAPGARVVDVLAGGRQQAGRVALMRVVRELASGAAVRSGALLLHAAALARAGRTVLLVGPKRAGKTTLLLRGLATPGATYVANDRVAVWTADGPVARGMPSIVSVRPEVVAGHSALASELRRTGYHHAVTMDEARQGGTWWRSDGAADLTPAQLCDLLRVGVTAEAKVAAVVFLSACPGAGPATLERLPTHEALPRLLDGRFGGHGTPVSSVFTAGADDAPGDPATTEGQCRRLLAAAPAFAFRFEPARLESRDALAVVDEVLRS